MEVMLLLEEEYMEAKLLAKMCDKKNYVLFTDSECLVLSPNFKLPDENQILLKTHRQDNMYSFDMKNIVPKDCLTCLVAKATSEESMLWHRRLGHINFKNINKLVKENLNGIAIHMLIEKKYPLSQEMISKMLKKKLEVDHESSQAFELLSTNGVSTASTYLVLPKLVNTARRKINTADENGNSWVPIPVTAPETGPSTATKMIVPSTAEEKTCKKNDVKARSLLLMALPNEHQLTFDQYVDAQSMFAAIKARFGGNEATKKTQKALLKQQYENFNASSSESLDSIFNRLQKLVSRLAILGVVTPPEDLNVKFLRSLPSEWDTHVVVWMNKPDFDTMGLDDLYNNFKIVEQKVKKSVGTNNDDKNLAFLTTSGASSTNIINTVNPEVSTGNTKVNTASTEISTASFSDATVYAFLSTQPQGSQLVHEDLEQLHDDDLEEMDLKWNMALLSMRARKFYQRTRRKIIIDGSNTAGYDKSKVECFNCHKMGHFARECRAPRSKDNRNWNQGSSSKAVKIEDASEKAMCAIDGRFDLIGVTRQWKKFRPKWISWHSQILRCIELDNSKENTDDSLKQQQKTDSKTSSVKSPLKVDKDWKEKFFCPTNHFREEEPKKARENNDAPIIEDWVSDDKDEVKHIPKVEKKTVIPTATKKEFIEPEKQVRRSVSFDHIQYNCPKTSHPSAHKHMAPRAVLMKSGLKSVNTARLVNIVRYMTGNIAHLSDFKDFDGGYVTFCGGAYGGRIIGKGLLNKMELLKGSIGHDDSAMVKKLELESRLGNKEKELWRFQEKQGTGKQSPSNFKEVTLTEVIQDQGRGRKGSVEVILGECKTKVTLYKKSESKGKRQDKGNSNNIESEPKMKSQKEIEQKGIEEMLAMDEEKGKDYYLKQKHCPGAARKIRSNTCKNQGTTNSDFKGISYNEIRPIFEKVWDFNQNIEPMDMEHGSEKMKSPEKIEERDVDIQKEMTEVVKESVSKRKKSLPRKRMTFKNKSWKKMLRRKNSKGF
ncbi:putative ribonuclease H-like domain-containing protein [Tanacetum coccineum]